MASDLLSGRRVLLVEDDMLVAMHIEDMLDEMGCEVIGPAAKVEQAHKLIETAKELDAAVLDVNLNGVMSYPIADELVACGVPFVFLTGYDKKFLNNEYSRFPLMQKPITLLDLSAAIAGLLGQDGP